MDDGDALTALLRPFLTAPGRAGVLTDFDGTLSAIVDDPEAAGPLPEAVALLHRLAARYRRVAVVSGRPAAFLARALDLASHEGSLVVSGLYGLEYAQGETVTVHPSALEWRRVVDGIAELADELAPPGVHVEHKGLSVTLHYRTAPEAAPWVHRWAGEQASRTGLARHPARMSEELRPPVSVDKGSVVTELAEDLDAVCFMGDDAGDLPAFAALDRLAAERGTATLKVVAASGEAPEAVLAAADVLVDGPEGAVGVLRALLDERVP